jgi:hypothetical protein
MADDYTLNVRRFDPSDRRLGRHVVHDSRSRRFAAPARDPKTLASVRHTVHIPVMDQGDVGSCTGHAGTNALASGDFWQAGQGAIAGGEPHAYAVGLYSAATVLDPWPGQYTPDDTGSDGLSVAKVLQQRGLISGYQHALSLSAALTGLAERVVMIGSNWTSSMFTPDSSGRITVGGSVEGGHEYALDELDVAGERVWLRNSWSESWGIGGRAWMVWDDLGQLLAADGDCTILVPRSEPAPTPQPVPPKPARPKEDVDLAEAFERWMKTSAGPHYMRERAAAWMAVFKE